jgi:predicted DNA-binding transcriptional regulator YafY
MKLYSILNELILEAASDAEVSDAIVKHNRVKIRYQEPNGTYSTRYLESYVLGLSKAGNPIVRAYQYAGDTTTEIGWKTFRLDRIMDWEEMNERPFSNPISDRVAGIPKYNRLGDGSMTRINKQAKF